jgi:hypothetical protein
MVRRLGLAGLSAAMMISLAACQVLFIGVFPGTVGQTTARRDLSAVIGASQASSFRLATLSANGRDYVLLFSSAGFDPSQAHLVIMDGMLNVIRSYSNSDLATQPAFMTSLSGSSALTDLNGDMLVGNLRFQTTSGTPTPFATNLTLDGPAITVAPIDFYIETGFTSDGINLHYIEYNAAWTLSGFSPYVPLGTPSPAPASGLQLVGVFSDPIYPTPATLAFGDSQGGYIYFVLVPKADINTGFPLVFSPAYAQTSRRDLQWQSISASRQGVVAYDHRSGALIRFTVDDPGAVSEMTIQSDGNVETAQGQDGTYCVVWDIDHRVLTRYEHWWQTP